jgi:hypothetical protein
MILKAMHLLSRSASFCEIALMFGPTFARSTTS